MAMVNSTGGVVTGGRQSGREVHSTAAMSSLADNPLVNSVGEKSMAANSLEADLPCEKNLLMATQADLLRDVGRNSVMSHSPIVGRTYADMVDGTGLEKQNTELKCITISNRDVYKFTMEEVQERTLFWQFTLIGGVLGPPIKVSDMERFLDNSWMGLKPIVNVKMNGIWTFRFRSQEEVEKIMNAGTWLVNESHWC